MRTNALKFCLLLLFLSFTQIASAQYETAKNGNFNVVRTSVTPSPEMALYQRYGDVPVDYSTGIANISVPITEIKLKDFSWPVSLSYHGGGNKVSEFASVVGLGWVLNASGYITNSSTDGTGWGAEIMRTYNLAKRYNPYYGNCDVIYENELDVIAAGLDISQKSLFRPIVNYVNTPLMNLKFLFRDTSYVTAPISNYKIVTNSTSTIITDPSGNRYFFQPVGGKTTYTSCQITSTTSNASVGLSKILTYKGDSILFNYDTVNYTYTDLNYETKQRVNTLDCQRCQQDVIPDNKNCPVNNIAYELILTSITASNGQKVSFHYGNRSDHPVNKKLETILVQELSDGLYVNKAWYTLGQSYFGTSSDDNLRLKLDNVKNIINSHNQEVYGFDYFTSSVLPNRLSKSIDLAGFYNGISSNTTLIPSLSDRRSFLYYTMAGALTKINYPTGGSSTFTYDLSTWGGLRIKEITDYTSSNTIARKKNYDYGITGVHINYDFTSNDNQYFFGHGNSGMVSSTLPLYSLELITCTVFTEQTTAVTNFLDAWTEPSKFYAKVTEYAIDYTNDIQGEAGKTIYKYNDYLHFDLKARQASLISLSPKLTEKEVYKGLANELIHKEENFYSVADDYFPVPDFWGKPKNSRDERFWIKRLELLRDEMTHSLSADLEIPGYRCYGKEFLQHDYWLDIPVIYLDKQIVRTYEGGQEITNEKNYTYDKLNGEIEPNQITSTTSDDDTINEQIRYTTSNLTGITYNMAESNANNKLLHQNIITPLWRKTSKGATEVQTSQIYYNIFYNKAFPVKEKIGFGGAETKEAQVTKYDGKGNAIEILSQNLKTTAYRFSNKSEITAEFVNSSYDETAYASFDNGGENGISYTQSAVSMDEAYSGKSSYKLNMGAISKHNLIAGKRYSISLFIKSGTITISGATAGTAQMTTLSNGWNLYQNYFTPLSSSVEISGSAFIDDIKIHPENAQSTTFVYTNFYEQLAAKADTRSNTTFFDYQPDGKLWSVKDHLGNIVKQYCYNLAGQTVDCNIKPTIALPNYYARISISNIYTEYPNGPFSPAFTTFADVTLELFTDAEATIPYITPVSRTVAYEETLLSDLGYGPVSSSYIFNRTIPAGTSSVMLGRYAIDRVYEETDPFNPWMSTIYSTNLSYQVVSIPNVNYIPLATSTPL
ncbi:hypothetical protein [Pedobacter chitinilyticus]|uniref:YD repeat-containing protein n=1 Tax=Pedobacter chitinilyticus TaxID=2233776 RepID=A0A3S3PI29_9SPHI|nr:hypothetical protein [Pedobacter chitinilyticus]RWU09932.1 hypothetical protein DPV69_00880 [Pedobacter chitinilyticus]